MTSDAKIGLLLGLVFIFVIAFIINGLPNLKQTTKGEVSPIMVPAIDHDLGVTGRTPGGLEDWSTPTEQETVQETSLPVDLPPTVAQEPPQSAQPQPESPRTAEEGVRSTFPIPSIDALLSGGARVLESLQRERQEAATDIPVPAVGPATASERQPAVEAARPRTESGSPATVTRVPETREPARPAAALNKVVGKIYVVVDGDNLGSIAKKVYGIEEGNRVVNSDRIYEANKEQLASRNDVRVGQKLIIPPLPNAAPATPRPADVLPKELFERKDLSAVVDALKRPLQPAPSAPPAPTPQNWQGRWYVVQDGDYLWKIASTQLGAGARYEEIRKLNADLLKNGNNLDVGMKLRLPAK